MVELIGYPAKYANVPKEGKVILGKGSKVSDVRCKIGFSSQIPAITLVNGVIVDKDRLLKEGDHVTILPPVSGG